MYFFITCLYAAINTHEIKLNSKFGSTFIRIHESDTFRMEKIADVVRNKFIPVIEYFQYAPKYVHIISNDYSYHNAFATVIPKNTIGLYNFPPPSDSHLSINLDWIETTIIHEFIHIIQLDKTSGLFTPLTRIFGSAFKWNYVNPTWFKEGLATWGEGIFSDYGRAKNEKIKSEVFKLLTDPNFCTSIFCIDIPGKYPYGHSPYWIGGIFLDYLETKRPGTMSCLVRSGPVLLLMNRPNACLQDSFKNAFLKFRQDFISSKKESSLPFPKKNLPQGYYHYDSGMALYNNTLYLIKDDPFRSYILAWNYLLDSTTIIRPKRNVHKMIGSSNNLHITYMLNWGDKYQYYGESLNLDTKKFDKLENSPYSLKFPKGILTINYNNRWVFKYLDKTLSLPNLINFTNLVILNDSSIAFKIIQNNHYYYLKLDLDTFKLTSIYQSSNHFELIGLVDKSILLREKNNLVFIDNTTTSLYKDFLPITSLIFTDKTDLVITADDYLYYTNIESFKKILEENKISKTKTKKAPFSTSENTYPKVVNTSRYPDLIDLVPGAWLPLNYQVTGDNAGTLTQLMIPIIDPRLRHQLWLYPTHSTRPKDKEWDFYFTYYYSTTSNTLLLGRAYNPTEGPTINISGYHSFFTLYNKFDVGLKFTKEYSQKTAMGNFTWTKKSKNINNFFTSNTLSINPLWINHESELSSGVKISNVYSFKLTDRFTVSILANYIKLRKPILTSHSLSNQFELPVNFLSSSDKFSVYGYDIRDSEISFDYQLFDIYKLSTFKELHLLAAAKHTRAQAFDLDEDLGKYRHSITVGIRQELRLLQAFDTDLVMAGTKEFYQNGKIENYFTFGLSSGIGFFF